MEVDNNESSKSTSTSDSDNCDCNHYKTIMNLNGLSINMITAQESILLDLIDSIKDKNQQRKLIEHVLASSREKKLEPKVVVVVSSAYTMIEVLGRLKKDIPLSLHNLRTEINSLKLEVVQLRRRIEVLELINTKNAKDMDLVLKTLEESEFQIGESSNTPKESYNPKDYLNIIERTISRKCVKD